MNRRKRLSFILVLALVLELIPFPVWEPAASETVVKAEAAEATATPGPLSGTCGENISWELTVDNPEDWDLDTTPYKLTLTGSGKMKSYDITTVPWCYYRGNISTLSIGEGITNIGAYAFNYLASLETVVIPDSVTTIEKGGFYGCALLQEITFGSGVRTIKDNAFSFLPSLKKLSLREGIVTLGYSSFGCCYNLKEVELPESLQSIGQDSFRESSLETLYIPKNVTYIEGNPILSSKKFKSFQIDPANSCFKVSQDVLYEMKDSAPYRVIAFPYLSEETSLNILRGTQIIERDGLVDYVGKVTELSLPNTLKTIEMYAIMLPSLEILEIPDSVDNVGAYAIGYCKKLKKLSIGKNVQSLERAVYFCTALETVEVDEANPYLCGIDNVVYNEACTRLYLYGSGKPETVFHMPDSVEYVCTCAIMEVEALKEVYMSASLVEITNNNGLSHNENLKSIYFKGNANENWYPFAVSDNATNLIIYREADSTGWDINNWESYFAFAIWDQENTFVDQGEVDGITWKYEGANGRLTLQGNGTMPDYTEAAQTPWQEYLPLIQTIEMEGISSLGNYAFAGGESLLRSESEEELDRIGDFSFSSCKKLRYIDISSVSIMGKSALEGAKSISGTLSLEKVSSLGAGAFKDCTKLSMVTLGNQLEVLEEEVFAGCTGLCYFIIPESVTTIKAQALKGCTGLYSINIPALVNSIGSEAFAENTSMERVYFYGDVPETWESDSFTGCNDNLTLYYRDTCLEWNELKGAWNGIPTQKLSQFYTENKDHYSFANTRYSFGYSAGYRIPRRQYVDVLDVIKGSYYYAVNGAWKGSCYGMAATTLEFYENEAFNISNYGGEGENLYNVSAPQNKDADLTKLIELYQLSQYVPSIAGAGGVISSKLNGYGEIIAKIEEFERSGGFSVDSNAEPIILCIYSKYGGHAVIPVSVEQTKEGDYAVEIYDPNYPTAFQTLKINKTLDGLSYRNYTIGCYISYKKVLDVIESIDSDVLPTDDSIYLSIDKEDGVVKNAHGKTLEEIKGAYEQKFMTTEEINTFSGIKSFVVPGDSYELGTEDSGENTAEDVKFYAATSNLYSEISSTDENSILQVEQAANGNNTLAVVPGSAAANETTTICLINESGMKKTIEVPGSETEIKVSQDDTDMDNVQVKLPSEKGNTILVNGEEMTSESGIFTLSFVAKEGENPLAIDELATEVSYESPSSLNGSVDVSVLSNYKETTSTTVTVTYTDAENNVVAEFSEEKELEPGLNTISMDLAGIEADFNGLSGEVELFCSIKVEDAQGNIASNSISAGKVSVTVETATPVGTATSAPETESTGIPETKPTGTPETESTANPETTPTIEPEKSPEPTDSFEPASSGEPTENPVPTPTQEGENKTPEPEQTPTIEPEVTSQPEQTLEPQPTQLVTGVGSNASTDSAIISPDGIPEGFDEVVNVQVNKKKLVMGIDEKYQIKAKVVPANAKNQNLEYIVYGDCITVTKTGKIKALNPGKAKVLVEAFNGKVAVIDVIVKRAPNKITLNKRSKVLKKGKTFQIKAKFPKNTASANLTYQSSNKKVAKVTAEGKVKARRKGRTVITVKTYNGKKAKITIIVT